MVHVPILKTSLIPMNCQFMPKRIEQKKKRGLIQQLVREDQRIVFLQWKDNKRVYVLSTRHSKNPISSYML